MPGSDNLYHGNLATFSDILSFFYTISLSIVQIMYKIRLYIVCHRSERDYIISLPTSHGKNTTGAPPGHKHHTVSHFSSFLSYSFIEQAFRDFGWTRLMSALL